MLLLPRLETPALLRATGGRLRRRGTLTFTICDELIRPPRRLTEHEISLLLAADVPARLATLDNDGFPHVTPLWFLWTDGAFHLTSFSDRPHVRRLARNSRAGICVDFEEPLRADGERPNRQLRAVGNAELFPDRDATWTRRIHDKYVASERLALGHDQPGPRILIRLRPLRLVAVASV